MIEDVVELAAEFHLHALGDGKRFSSAHIDLPGARTAKEVTRRIAKLASRRGKWRGIDPVCDRPAAWRGERDSRNQVRTLRARGPIRRGVTAGQKHVDREAGARQRRRA